MGNEPPPQQPPTPPPPPGQQPPGQPPGAPPGPGGTVTAEWWKRLVAFIIDGVLLGIVSNIIAGVLFAGLFATSGMQTITDPNTGQSIQIPSTGGFFAVYGGIILASLLISAAYFTILHAARGQTLGKMALSIKVVDAETGQLLDYGTAFIRWLIYAVLSLACGIGLLVDGLWPLWDERRQALHDKPAKSLVVDA